MRLYPEPPRQRCTYGDYQMLFSQVNRAVVTQEKMVGVILCRAVELIQPVPLHGGIAGWMIGYGVLIGDSFSLFLLQGAPFS
jgi:hypothetical protein